LSAALDPLSNEPTGLDDKGEAEVSTIGTIKKIAASTAIAASLGLGGLSLASGIASAAPGDHAGSGGSTKSEHQAHSAPKTATGGDDSVIHAHLIPGFTPKPAPGDATIPAHLIPGFTPKPVPTATPQPVPTSAPRLGNMPGMDPAYEDELRRCGIGCFEIIDE
jgi:hypothetical protein